MPPKKTDSGASKKTVEKIKAKIVEDKTFGLKNKKGNKQQKFIETVQKQVTTKPARTVNAVETTKEKKEKEKAAADELKALFKPVVTQQKVAADVDPKSVLCAFYKAGQCGKGDRCKFSHDLEVERKVEKRNIYSDVRDGGDPEENMENWDDAKLQEVVMKKHGEEEMLKPKTDIVCKHFLAAIEDNKYGWFWECPSGGDKCIYKHALPAGFVLKKDKKKMDEQNVDTVSLEDLIEKERAALGGNLTKVTLVSFKAWKIKKRKERIEKLESDKRRKENEFQAGRLNGLSGRDMFTFNPEMAGEDDEEADDMVYKQESDEEGEDHVPKDIDESLFVEEEADGTGTNSITTVRDGGTSSLPTSQSVPNDEQPSTSRAGGDNEVTLDVVPVDADLFDEDDESEEDDASEGQAEEKDSGEASN